MRPLRSSATSRSCARTLAGRARPPRRASPGIRRDQIERLGGGRHRRRSQRCDAAAGDADVPRCSRADVRDSCASRPRSSSRRASGRRRRACVAARAGAGARLRAAAESPRRATSSSTSRAIRSGTPAAGSSTCSACSLRDGERWSFRRVLGARPRRGAARVRAVRSTSSTSGSRERPGPARLPLRAGRADGAEAADGDARAPARRRSTTCCAARSSSTSTRSSGRGCGSRSRATRSRTSSSSTWRARGRAARRRRRRSLAYERWRDERRPGRARRDRGLQRGGLPLDAALLRDWLLERKAEARGDVGEPRSRGATTPRSRSRPSGDEAARRSATAREPRLLERGDARRASCSTTTAARRSRPGGGSSTGSRWTPEELIEDAEAIGGLEPVGERRDGRDVELSRSASRCSSTSSTPGDAVIDPRRGKGAGRSSQLDDAARHAHDPARARSARRASRCRGRSSPAGRSTRPASSEALLRLARSLRDGDGRYPALEACSRREPPLGGERRASPATTSRRRSALVERARRPSPLRAGPARLRQDVHRRAADRRTCIAARQARRRHRARATRRSTTSCDEIEQRGATKRRARSAGCKNGDGGNARVTERDDRRIENVDDSAGVLRRRRTARRRHRLAVRAREELDEHARLPLHRRGRPDLARRRARDRAPRARNARPARRPAAARPGLAGRSTRTGSGASVLEHLLGDDATIPQDRGLFLEQTRRMHPDVCRFISDESTRRLAHLRTARCKQPPPAPASASSPSSTPATASAPEEADAIAAEIDRLLGTSAPTRTAPRARSRGRHHGRRAVQRPGAPAPSSSPTASPSAPSTSSRARRRRSSSSRWRPRAARTCRATSSSSSPATASTSPSPARAASPTSSAAPACSPPRPQRRGAEPRQRALRAADTAAGDEPVSSAAA